MMHPHTERKTLKHSPASVHNSYGSMKFNGCLRAIRIHNTIEIELLKLSDLKSELAFSIIVFKQDVQNSNQLCLLTDRIGPQRQ